MVWRFLDFQRYNAFENMAIDEAIFRETVKNKVPPTIRFYGWRPAAVSIGYFQDVEKEINVKKCCAAGVDIVRRISGGKAVYHCSEVTYSVIASIEEKSFPADIVGTYKVISDCITRGLADLGIVTALAEAGRPLPGDAFTACCFSVPSRNELLVAGRKICGSAQMRTSGGFLQHGSLLMDFDPVQTASFLLPARTDIQLKTLRDSVAAVNEEMNRVVDEEEICASLKRGFVAVLRKEIEAGALTPVEEKLAHDLMHKYKDLGRNPDRKEF